MIRNSENIINVDLIFITIDYISIFFHFTYGYFFLTFLFKNPTIISPFANLTGISKRTGNFNLSAGCKPITIRPDLVKTVYEIYKPYPLIHIVKNRIICGDTTNQ